MNLIYLIIQIQQFWIHGQSNVGSQPFLIVLLLYIGLLWFQIYFFIFIYG